MIANFKNDKKIIVTGADRAESLLISQLVNIYKEKDIELKEFYDIEGDVNGFSLELKERVEQTPGVETAEGKNKGE